ncbi:MAG: class I SAM-dependent methyltransferase, partial [Chloroflexota bacterium]
MNQDHLYRDQVFTLPNERMRSFTEMILPYVSPQEPWRILDIGCGTGEQILDLAQTLPQARFTGIDISRPNITIAEKARQQSPYRDRLGFVAMDYMCFDEGCFDLIISSTTLHLIPVPTQQLFTKIINDLAAAGILAFTMPYACLYNSTLALVRRVFRRLRSPLTDELIFSLGKALHRH